MNGLSFSTGTSSGTRSAMMPRMIPSEPPANRLDCSGQDANTTVAETDAATPENSKFIYILRAWGSAAGQ